VYIKEGNKVLKRQI